MIAQSTILFMTAALLSAAPAHSAAKVKPGPAGFDKAKFEAYVRHLFVWPPPIEIKVSDPGASPIPGFFSVKVHASQESASEDEEFYLSRDGKQIIRGAVYDINSNPFHDEIKKIKTADRPNLGTKGAPVVLAEFSDFQCHFCKQEANSLRENLLKDYPTQVHLYFFDFPIDALHPWARRAAIAGRCVYHQNADTFWKYHDWVFANQEKLTPDNLNDQIMDWAKSENMDAARLAACEASGETASEVDATLAMGKAVGVTSTPTTFVNGRPLPGQREWADVKRVIDFEIGYQQTARNAGENCGCEAGLTKTGVPPSKSVVPVIK